MTCCPDCPARYIGQPDPREKVRATCCHEPDPADEARRALAKLEHRFQSEQFLLRGGNRAERRLRKAVGRRRPS